jgi:hypothetical protein
LEALEHRPTHAVEIGVADFELAALGETTRTNGEDKPEGFFLVSVQRRWNKDSKAITAAQGSRGKRLGCRAPA